MKTILKEDCLKTLKLVFAYYKRDFSINDYNEWRKENSSHPSVLTIISKFQTWNEAKQQIGIEITTKSRKIARKNCTIDIDGKEYPAKECTICETIKVLDDFHRNKQYSDGRHSQCKDCYNIHKRKFHHENKERMNLKSRVYYAENKEAVSSRHKSYRTRKIKKQSS